MRWHAVNLNEFAGDWRVRDENDEDVLTLRYGHRDDHARLAAAAPQMLAVLEMVRDADDDCRRDGLQTMPSMARDALDRVIAKAKGRL